MNPETSATPSTEPRAQPAEAAAFELSPYCRHLGSKKLCFRTHPPQTDEDVLDASRHTWCRQSHQSLGPDGEAVDVADCRRGRACFVPF
jgi:hypothetical protein